MQIASIAARTIRWSIAGRGAARGRTERAAVVIEARTDRGVVGLGEAAPLPGMSPDTLDEAARAIAAFAQRAPIELDDREAAYRIAATTTAPAARFAIETALLDALARERHSSLAQLLCDGAAALPPGTVPLAVVVDDPEAARSAFAAGIRCFKIKLDAADDPGRVVAIAAAVPGARLRIDANRSWPRAEVAGRLAALAHLPIDYVEEPCADAHRLAAEPLACRIALDESLATITPDELRAALRGPALAALVLKPTLQGGLSAVTGLAAIARRAGVAAIVSHGLEGPVGTAACAELALALAGDHPVGLAAHAALDGWRVEVPQLAPGHVHPAAAPGLGFEGQDLASVVAACGARADL
jgi:o-succinylbenzoate synthase